MPPVALAAVAIGTAAVATGVSIYEGQQAASAQKKALEFQQQQADLSAARQQRDAIRQARIANAQANANAERQGVGLSSAAQGGGSSIISQLSSNLSFLDQYNYFSDQASKELGKAVSYRANQELFGQVAGAAEKVAYNAGPISDAAKKVFSKGGLFGGGWHSNPGRPAR